MANEYLDDFEQEQLVKKWIAENGTAILVGVALAIAAVFGYYRWEASQATNKVVAADDFHTFVTAVDEGADDLDTRYDFFVSDHGNDNVYVGYMDLHLAKKAVDDDDLAAAAEHLERAAGVARPAEVADVARLRLARVHAATGDYAAARSALDSVDDDAYQSLVAEIRGDILVEQGDATGALDAYQQALDNLEGGGDRNLLQMKIDDLSGGMMGNVMTAASPAPETESVIAEDDEEMEPPSDPLVDEDV